MIDPDSDPIVGQTDDEPAPRSRSLGGWLKAIGAMLVLLVAAGGFLTFGNESPNNSTAPATTITSVGTSPSVSAIAKRVGAATVDILSSNAYTGSADAGTGMILTPNGEVLTNNHVIAGGTTITARVDGVGARYKAKVVGVDPAMDVAVLQLQGASGLPVVPLGNSATVKVGEAVVAIGNALNLSGTPTVTSGTISALGRSVAAGDPATGSVEHLTGMLQTDAVLEPGNSGGPLVGANGQVIGMNTAAATGGFSNSPASTVGFAIPINRALAIVRAIMRRKVGAGIELGPPPFIGVEVENLSMAGAGYFGYVPPASSGVFVAGVFPDTPAAANGMRAGDVITSLGGRQVASIAGLSATMRRYHPGNKISITWVGPFGGNHSAQITLAAGPAA